MTDSEEGHSHEWRETSPTDDETATRCAELDARAVRCDTCGARGIMPRWSASTSPGASTSPSAE